MKIHVTGDHEKLKGHAAWLRETFVFTGPRESRDGYYTIQPGYMEIILLSVNLELFIKLKLGSDCLD